MAGGFLSIQKPKYFNLFLNISFLFLIFNLTTHLYSSDFDFLKTSNTIDSDNISCKGLHKHHDNQSKCSYVKSHTGCQPTGYISYIQIFYCIFTPPLGYTLFIIWLILLFYLLGDTAANYFCSSLEGLSRILKLSPTIAGVTLLSLGNGAPDLSSSIISFMGENTKDVGLNSILGGAFFVSTVVVGIISISVCRRRIFISKSSFIRDVGFLLFSLVVIVMIIGYGKINLWGALSFLCLYFVYVFLVSCSLLRGDKEDKVGGGGGGGGGGEGDSDSLILPVSKRIIADDLTVPLLGYSDCRRRFHNLQSWVRKILWILELPLYLSRRLSVPVVSEERWSKPFAVFSATISPVLLSIIWNSNLQKPNILIYGIGVSIGIISGILAFFTTENSNPPTKCLLIWLVGGFLMSITWTYILAQELISLLVSLGLIIGINPSILGLTILAWGNSLGDLVANLTMAKHGGPDGAQVAIFGCYAGPIFNIVVGLGLSLSFSAWNEYPSCYILPKDPFVYETVGFLMCGLLWALVILPMKNMRLDRFLGGGLLTIYLCFLSLKMARTLDLVPLIKAPTSHYRH